MFAHGVANTGGLWVTPPFLGLGDQLPKPDDVHPGGPDEVPPDWNETHRGRWVTVRTHAGPGSRRTAGAGTAQRSPGRIPRRTHRAHRTRRIARAHRLWRPWACATSPPPPPTPVPWTAGSPSARTA